MAHVINIIYTELVRLKTLLLQKSIDSNDIIASIDAIIKSINTTAEYSPSPSELKFAYSRLQTIRHSAELLHGIDVKSDSENYKKIKAIMQATPETIGAHETLATTSDATVIDPPVDDLQKEKELHEEQEKLRDNTEFLTLLRASNLHTIQTKTATKKIFISYAWPGQPRWYTAEDMQLLLAHYCNHNARLIPIKFDDLHWALIYIDSLANAFFIDPLSSDINPDIRIQYPNISIPKHLVCKEKSYDTGPWLVEIARLITEQDKLPDTIPNMKDAREIHATVMTSLKESDSSSEAEKKFDEPWTKELVKQLAIHLTIAGFQVYLDELHSCDGYPLVKFMKKIKKVDHVLFISTRTMGHKLGFKESGVRFELQQALEASSGKIGKRFFIPILLNNTPHYASEIKSLGLAEVSMCQNGYFNSLRDLITRLYYGVHSVDFSNFWLDTWFIENIKKYYLRQNKIEILDGLVKSMDIEKNSIHLTLMKEEEQNKKETNLHDSKEKNPTFLEDTRLVLFENLHRTNDPVKLEDIFEPDKKDSAKPTKRISVLGNAGTGKSTLCQHAAYLWAKGSLWNNKFRLLIWIPLRELVTLNDEEATLSHFIAEKYSARNHAGDNMFTPEQARSLLARLDPNAILFVLDGSDEVSEQLNQRPDRQTKQGHLIQHLFSDHIINVIITSRPFREEKYIYSCPRKLAVTGFLDNGIDQYIEKYFTEEPEKEKYMSTLKSFLEKNKNVKEMAHTPLNLTILCFCWKNRLESPSQTTLSDITLTSLYEELFVYLAIRYLQNKCGDNPKRTTPKFILNHPKVIKLRKALCKLAFETMKESSLIISSKQINALLDEHEDDGTLLSSILTFGLLKPLERGRPVDQKSYYFMHLTLQEYLAAMAWANSFTAQDEKQSSIATDWLTQNRYNPTYYVFWRFTAGSLNKDNSEDSIKVISKYLGALFEEDSTIDICFKLSLWIICLCEIKNDELTKRYVVIIRDKLTGLFQDHQYGSNYPAAQNCSRLFSVILENPYIIPYLDLFEIIRPIISSAIKKIHYKTNHTSHPGQGYLSLALEYLLKFFPKLIVLDSKNLELVLECYSLIFNEKVYGDAHDDSTPKTLLSSPHAANAINDMEILIKNGIDFNKLLPALMNAVLHLNGWVSFAALRIIDEHIHLISQSYSDPTNTEEISIGISNVRSCSCFSDFCDNRNHVDYAFPVRIHSQWSRIKVNESFSYCLEKAYLRHPITNLQFYVNLTGYITHPRGLSDDFWQKYHNQIIEIILKINSPWILNQFTSRLQLTAASWIEKPWPDRAKKALENLEEKKTAFTAGFFGAPQLTLPAAAENASNTLTFN